MKRAHYIALLFIVLLSMSSCNGRPAAKEYEKFPLKYSENGFQIIIDKVSPAVPLKKEDAEWLDVNSYSFYKDFDLIAKAKINSIVEVSITYTKEISRTIYTSLLSLELEEIYYSSGKAALNEKNVVASYEICSHAMVEDAILPKEGEEYYLFLQKAEYNPSPLNYAQFCDYIVRLPKTERCVIRAGGPLTAEIAELLKQSNEGEKAETVLKEGADIEETLTRLFGER